MQSVHKNEMTQTRKKNKPKPKPKRRKPLRQKWYKYLCERDGERCHVCVRMPPEVYLEIHHVDGNKHNNSIDGSNYELLCRHDHHLKHPRGKAHGTVQYGVPDLGRELTPEMQVNKRCEWAWRHWLYDELKKRGRITAQEAIFSGAEVVGCSPETIRQRYLPKACSAAGMFRRFNDDTAGMDMIAFRNATTLGIDMSKYDFIDDPQVEVE